MFQRFVSIVIDIFATLLGFVLVAIPLTSYDERFALPCLAVGFLFAIVYLLFHDGFHGAGIGKRLLFLRVLDAQTGAFASYSQAAKRHYSFLSTIVVLDFSLPWCQKVTKVLAIMLQALLWFEKKM